MNTDPNPAQPTAPAAAAAPITPEEMLTRLSETVRSHQTVLQQVGTQYEQLQTRVNQLEQAGGNLKRETAKTHTELKQEIAARVLSLKEELKEDIESKGLPMMPDLAELQSQLQELKDSIEVKAPGSTPSFAGKQLKWDTRKIHLTPLADDKLAYRGFAFTLKAFIKREAPRYEQFLNTTERAENEITLEDLDKAGIDISDDAEMMWVLTNYTEASAKDLVQLHGEKTGCEVWRQITRDFDPKSGTQGMQAMQRLMSPIRCRNYQDLKKSLARWDALLQAETKRGGHAAELGSAVKATAILPMVPKCLEEELLKKVMRWWRSMKRCAVWSTICSLCTSTRAAVSLSATLSLTTRENPWKRKWKLQTVAYWSNDCYQGRPIFFQA